jgi:hypothetical protein
VIGAGASLLGNIKVGDGAQIGACSLVLEDIPENCVAVGVPAKVTCPCYTYTVDVLTVSHRDFEDPGTCTIFSTVAASASGSDRRGHKWSYSVERYVHSIMGGTNCAYFCLLTDKF